MISAKGTNYGDPEGTCKKNFFFISLCCRLGSYFKRPKTVLCVLQLVLLRTVYSQAQGCVYTALQLSGDVEQSWLMSKYDVIHKTGSGNEVGIFLHVPSGALYQTEYHNVGEIHPSKN